MNAIEKQFIEMGWTPPGYSSGRIGIRGPDENNIYEVDIPLSQAKALMQHHNEHSFFVPTYEYKTSTPKLGEVGAIENVRLFANDYAKPVSLEIMSLRRMLRDYRNGLPPADTTDLCTVREWAEHITHSKEGFIWNQSVFDGPNPPRDEMAFTHKGKRYNVEMIVTRCEDAE